MKTYVENLNTILKNDKIVKETDETMQTIRGNVVTIWQKLSAHKFQKVESFRSTPTV